MELKINPKPLAEATLDLDRFRQEMKSSLDLEKAVMPNLTMKKNEIGEKAKELIFFFTCWEDVLKLMGDKKTMQLRICGVTYKDKTLYKPKATDGCEMVFSEDKISGEGLIVLNDAVSNNHNIKTWMDCIIPTYMFATVPKWKPLEALK